MNSREIQDRLEKIKIEDIIWVIYLVIIILSFLANSIERDYFLTNNVFSKKRYQSLMIFIFMVLTIIYTYFTYDTYKDIINLTNQDSSNKRKFTYISFFATLLVLISGILFLYISIKDKEIETEIAFN